VMLKTVIQEVIYKSNIYFLLVSFDR